MAGRAVVSILIYGEMILIGKKKISSEKYFAGEWHFPCESVEEGETDEEALKRGVREEAGIEILVGRYLATSVSPTSKKEVRFYECFAETEDIESGSDLEDVRFVPRKDAIDFISEKVRNYLPKEIFDYLNR